MPEEGMKALSRKFIIKNLLRHYANAICLFRKVPFYAMFFLCLTPPLMWNVFVRTTGPQGGELAS